MLLVFVPASHKAFWAIGECLRALQDQRRLSLVHRLLESTLVERLAERIGAATVSAQRDKTSATL